MEFADNRKKAMCDFGETYENINTFISNIQTE